MISCNQHIDHLCILLQQFSGCGESTRYINQGAARGYGTITIMASGERRRIIIMASGERRRIIIMASGERRQREACGCGESTSYINQGAARGCGATTIMAGGKRRRMATAAKTRPGARAIMCAETSVI